MARGGMVGRLFSFCDGFLVGALKPLVSGSVFFLSGAPPD